MSGAACIVIISSYAVPEGECPSERTIRKMVRNSGIAKGLGRDLETQIISEKLCQPNINLCDREYLWDRIQLLGQMD